MPGSDSASQYTRSVSSSALYTQLELTESLLESLKLADNILIETLLQLDLVEVAAVAKVALNAFSRHLGIPRP